VGVVLAALAGCGEKAETVTVTVGEQAGPGASDTFRQFGYVKSLEPTGDGYELTFDPAWLLSGETANRAAAEDGVVQPGEPVPNDYYVLNEGDRLLTYRVPADAHVTVLRDGVDGSEITVDELAALVRGEEPFGKPLFEPITTGFWVETRKGDTVRSLAQQYFP
jgi:hypothetical protein